MEVLDKKYRSGNTFSPRLPRTVAQSEKQSAKSPLKFPNMKVIVAGHQYELQNASGSRIIGTLFFIHKKLGENGKLELVKDGTTTEEVLSVLIDRIEYLQTKLPCKENEGALASLRQALKFLNQRTASRDERGVEGTHKE